MRRSSFLAPLMPLLLLFALLAPAALAQNVGIGTTAPNVSAVLDITSANRGFLPPRLTASQRIAIASPATGLLVFQTDGTQGIYYYTGVAWVNLANGRIPDANGSALPPSTAVVSTLAGTAGSRGGTDGTGAAARFNRPSGVAVDAAGTVYVADQANNVIRKVTAAGVVSTLAGSAGNSGSADGTGAAARFFQPASVAVDAAGAVYVGDQYNSTIRKITAAGVVTTLAGTAGNLGSADGTGAAASFAYPAGVAVDAAGTVYVADQSNSTIRKITAAGVVSTLAGTAPSTGSADGTGATARFNNPGGVAVDAAGAVYVADQNNSTIRVIKTPTSVPSGADFIQNGTVPQANASFNISGAGTVGGLLTAGSATVSGPLAAGSGTVSGLLTAGSATVSGNVGIGTATPGQKLDVTGNTNVTGNSYVSGNVGIGTTAPRGGFDVASSGDNYLVANPNSGNGQTLFLPGHLFLAPYSGTSGMAYIQGRVPNPTASTNLGLVLRTTSNGNLLEPLTLNANGTANFSGNVGIGTTSPGYNLDVNGTVGFSGNAAQQLTLTSTATDPTGMLTFNFPAANLNCSSCTEMVIFNKAGTGNIGSISANLFYNTVSYNTSSDRRLKEHIRPTHYGLRDLLKIEVKDYNFIGTAAAHRTTGFLAQDLFRINPEAVKEGDHGPTVTNQWAVDYGKLTPLLVQAIQDQQAIIEAQQRKIAALEAAAAADKAQATATTDAFEARLRRLEAGSVQAQR